MLLASSLKAQTQDSTIAIPNPSFEQWSTGSGYSVTVVIFPLQVFSSYTYPTGWNYPTYPVNESITYSGMTVNVNTNLPLLKVSNETSNVPDGGHALKLQSFMLSDIISSTVYNLASSSLDPMLTTTVFPTVLSTGIVDIDQLLPMLYDITSNLGSLSQMLSAFSGTDINTIIDGGIALDGAIPDRLTGYYKYTSAVSGDNGGVLMLGTKYNTATHMREVVGGGYTIAMNDVNTYTPFEISYSPLSEVNPSYPYVEADSLILFLFSSANTSPQQGSALFLDGLQLWAQQPTIPSDTCSAIFNLTANSVDTTHATISWTYEGTPDHFEVEYGIQGFSQGSGTTANTSNSSLSISGLQPGTHYDVYVRSICSSTLMGNWSMVSFQTDTVVPPVIPSDTCSAIFNLMVSNVDTTHATINWTYEGTPDHFEVEYGIQGFSQGSGTTANTSNSSLSISGLQPGTHYDVYVRSICSSTLMGNWSMVTFQTDTLVPPVIPEPDTCSAISNLHVIEVDTMNASIGWSLVGEPDHFEAEYGIQGFSQGNGITVSVTESFLHLSDLQPDTYYDVYVRSVCNSDILGEWAMVSFHTDTLVPPVIPGDSTGIADFDNNRLQIYPNPAHGQCIVRFEQEIPQVIRLYTVAGVLCQEITPNKETIELTLPSTGVFILSCEMKEGTVTRRIVNW